MGGKTVWCFGEGVFDSVNFSFRCKEVKLVLQ